MKKHKVLLIEDELNISDVVKSYLEAANFDVIVAFSGLEGMKTYQTERIDLIILDLMLPDIDGFKICKFIKSLGDTPIIMLTARAKEADIISGLNIGADDYITKPFSPKQLVARVNAIIRRINSNSNEYDNVISFPSLKIKMDLQSHELSIDNINILLTPAEFNIFSLFLKYPNKTFTREELISHVFGNDYCGYDRTIDAHIKNLRRKIEKDTKNPCIILTVHGIGYRLCGSMKK